jgi:multidrug resistance protein, MATE family
MIKFEKYTTEIKTLFLLALPLMLAQLFNSGKGMVDTIMVGNIDKFNLAGLSLANGIFMLVVLSGAGVGAALVATISRLHAKKDYDKLHYHSMQAIYLNLILALIISVFLCNSHFIFNNFENLEPQTIQIASDYLKVLGLIWPFASLILVLRPIMQSFTKNKQILAISGAMFLLNIPLNYLFIFYFNMQAIGSAYATSICFFFEALFMLIYILKHQNMNPFAIFIKIDWAEVKTLFKISLPISLSIVLAVSLFTSVTFMLAKYGEVYVGANQIATNFLSFVFMFALGLNFALVQRVSFYIGLEKIDKIKVIIISAALLSTMVSLCTMILTYVFRYQIADIYTDNLTILNIAVNIFVISMFYQWLDGLQAVCTGVLRAYKLNKETFKIAFCIYTSIGFFAGYLLSLKFSIYGYWYGFCLCFLTLVVLYARKIYKIVWLDSVEKKS